MHPKAYGAINGALVACMVVAKALAPLAAAWIWTLSGSYGPVMLGVTITAGVMVVGVALAAIARDVRFQGQVLDRLHARIAWCRYPKAADAFGALHRHTVGVVGHGRSALKPLLCADETGGSFRVV
ncbi:MAG: hypothetical protein WC655_29885 [Candidatus Hydrogenedentales bacterium]|jgi:hypothetical protein